MSERRTKARRPRTKRALVLDGRRPWGWASESQRKAYEEMRAELEKAWKTSASDPIPLTWVRWTHAVIAAGSGRDIGPLAKYLEDVAAERDSALARPQLNDLASLQRLLYARGQKRGRGKPGGTHRRWGDPNYVTTWWVETKIAMRKRDNGGRNISDADRDK